MQLNSLINKKYNLPCWPLITCFIQLLELVVFQVQACPRLHVERADCELLHTAHKCQLFTQLLCWIWQPSPMWGNCTKKLQGSFLVQSPHIGLGCHFALSGKLALESLIVLDHKRDSKWKTTGGENMEMKLSLSTNKDLISELAEMTLLSLCNWYRLWVWFTESYIHASDMVLRWGRQMDLFVVNFRVVS